MYSSWRITDSLDVVNHQTVKIFNDDQTDGCDEPDADKIADDWDTSKLDFLSHPSILFIPVQHLPNDRESTSNTTIAVWFLINNWIRFARIHLLTNVQLCVSVFAWVWMNLCMHMTQIKQARLSGFSVVSSGGV